MIRGLFAAIAALAVGILMFAGALRLPDFGHYPGPYGDVVLKVAVPARHTQNVPTAVMYDIRGFDTLGEEFILFVTVTGLIVLLRERRGEPSTPGMPSPPGSPAIGAFARILAALTFAFGLYTIVHGPDTPGGGFQGGVIVGAAFLLIYLAGGFRMFDRFAPEQPFTALESLGAGAYAAIGVIAFAVTGVFLMNWLAPGRLGDPFSGGEIWVINLAVGLEVSASFTLMTREFLKEVS